MKLNVIPSVKSENVSGRTVTVPPVIYTDVKGYGAAAVFCGYAKKLGAEFTVKLTDAMGAEDSRGVYLKLTGKSGSIGGTYRLGTSEGTVNIFAEDEKGLHCGLATLLWLIDPQEDGTLKLPETLICDRPDGEYRGLMVDLARDWHPFKYLISYVDACYFYKLSTLHLHFTDDQSYTLPSRLYPKLSTPDRHYSFEEIEKLCAYAKARGIQLMPEIDVPGHMTSFAQAYPELFGNRGIICQHKASIGALAALFKELCELFPDSERIHIGGDEAALKNWLDCPECMEYARSIGIDTENTAGEQICDELYVNFINKMAETVLAMGRKPVVWEGFPKSMNRKVSRRMDVMSWENFYQTTPELLDAGFNIINSSWNPMYIVAPDVKWSREEVNAWSVRRWIPVHPGSPFAGKSYECEPCRQILGGQLQAWGDRIPLKYPDNIEEGVIEERRLILERLPFLAEHTWNTDKAEPFAELDAACGAGQTKLDKLID